jgi:hypothetical protein
MTMIATMDLNSPLPKSVVNFLMRNVAGVLLYALQEQAKKTMADPTCMYGQRIRENKEFYTNWFYNLCNTFLNVNIRNTN